MCELWRLFKRYSDKKLVFASFCKMIWTINLNKTMRALIVHKLVFTVKVTVQNYTIINFRSEKHLKILIFNFCVSLKDESNYSRDCRGINFKIKVTCAILINSTRTLRCDWLKRPIIYDELIIIISALFCLGQYWKKSQFSVNNN